MTKTAKRPLSFLQILWNIVFTLFYPILIAFSLLFVGMVWVFSMLSGLISKLWPQAKKEAAPAPPTWQPWVVAPSFKLDRLWIDEVMFGPAYYRLKTAESHDALETHYFGDFQHPCFGGVLLQKWNTLIPKELPDFDLVFFNGQTGTLHHLDTIRAFTWKVEETVKGVTLRWSGEQQQGQLAITEELLLHEARPVE